MKTKLPLSREYVEFVTELKSRIQSARISAARAVNRDLIFLYWDIGRGIVERQARSGLGDSGCGDSRQGSYQRAFPGTNGFSARQSLATCGNSMLPTTIPNFWDSLSQKHHPSAGRPKFWDSLFQN